MQDEPPIGGDAVGDEEGARLEAGAMDGATVVIEGMIRFVIIVNGRYVVVVVY